MLLVGERIRIREGTPSPSPSPSPSQMDTESREIRHPVATKPRIVKCGWIVAVAIGIAIAIAIATGHATMNHNNGYYRWAAIGMEFEIGAGIGGHATATSTSTSTSTDSSTTTNAIDIGGTNPPFVWGTSFPTTLEQPSDRHRNSNSNRHRYRPWSKSCPPQEFFREASSVSGSSFSSAIHSGTIAGFATPSCCCSIEDYGAIGDNSTLNTLAIQATIAGCHESCGSTHQHQQSQSASFAIVYVPPGMFRTGSLSLVSNLRLHLARGAALYGSDDPSDYPVVPMLPSGYETHQNTMYRALLSGTNLENVAITGDNAGYPPGSLAGWGGVVGQEQQRQRQRQTQQPNGHNDTDDSSLSVIDGVGWKWWCKAGSMPIPQDYCGAFNPNNETLPPHRFRPKLIEFSESTNIVLDRFTARNSPVWFVHPFLSRNILVTNLTVLAPREVGNTDGLDPDACENVHIESCYIDVGDDGVSIKSTNHTRKMAQTRNVTMRNLRIVSRNWCIGSATFGGIYDVLFEDSTIGDPETVTSPWAIKFKSHRYYPGPMENITIRRISMGKIGATPWMYPTAAGSALLLGLTYGEKPPARRRGMPLFRNVTIEDIDVVSAGMAGRVEGLPEDCLEGLTLRNVEVRGGSARWLCRNVDLSSLVVSNVHPSVSCTGGCNSSHHRTTKVRARKQYVRTTE